MDGDASAVGTLCLMRLVGWAMHGSETVGVFSRLFGNPAGERLLVDVRDKLPESIWNADSWEEMSK